MFYLKKMVFTIVIWDIRTILLGNSTNNLHSDKSYIMRKRKKALIEEKIHMKPPMNPRNCGFLSNPVLKRVPTSDIMHK